MPRNKINDLRNHLFEQMERLNDDELQGEALKSEIKRARAMKEIACQIVESAKVEVQYVKATKSKVSDFFPDTSTLPLNAVEPDKPKKLPLYNYGE